MAKAKIEKKYELKLTFTEKEMREIRDEVGMKKVQGILDLEGSTLDRLCYSVASTFHHKVLNAKDKVPQRKVSCRE